MAEIDSLEIKLQANAQSANRSITALIGKLDTLSTSLNKISGNNLTSLSNGVQRLSNAMQGMKNVGTADFTRLSKNIEKLGSLDATALGRAASSLHGFTNALQSLDSVNVSDNAAQIGTLAKGISQLGNKSAAQAIDNIPKLATATKQLMTTLSSAPKVSQNLIDMTNALANLSRTGAKSGHSASSLSTSLNTYSRSASRATKKTFSLASAFGKFYANFGLAIRGINKTWQSIEKSMDYVETYNYFDVTLDKIGNEFGNKFAEFGRESAKAYAESFSERLETLTSKMTGYTIGKNGELFNTGKIGLGLDPNQLMNFQARIGAVTNSVGLCGETSTNTAKALSMLSADMSSLTNTDLSSVMTNLQSGLIGQSRALYKYGIDITNATLQTYAYENGISKAVSEMTQAEKMQLRLIAILDQSRVAWGDQANTINSVANQYRILKQQVANLGRTIGNLFLPIVQKVLPYINAFVIVLNKLFSVLGFKLWGDNWLKDTMDGISGGTGLDDFADDVGDVADGLEEATGAAKKFKNQLQGFDELNVLTSSDSTSGAGSTYGGLVDLTDAIAGALADYESVWEEALAESQNKAQEYADIITGVFTDIWNAVEPFRSAISNLWDNGLSKLANFTWTSLGDFYNNFLVPIGTWAFGTDDAGLTRLVNVVNDGLMAIDWERINTSLKNFWIAIEPYAEQFGEGLIDFFEDVQGLAVDVINAFSGLMDRITGALNRGNPETARKWGYALGVLGAGVLALKGVGKIVGGIAALGNSLKTLSSGLGAIFGDAGLFANIGTKISGAFGALTAKGGLLEGISAGPIIGVAAAVLTLATGLTYAYQTNEEVRQSFSDTVSAIQEGLQPAIEFFTGTLLPDLNAGWDRLMEILSPLGEFLSGMFTSVWQDMINPALTYIGENVLPKVTEAFENLWNNVLVPLGTLLEDVLAPVIEIVSDALSALWESVVVPLADTVGNVLSKAFEELCDIFDETVVPIVNTVIEVFQSLWDNTLSPIVDYLCDNFKPVFEDVFEALGGVIDGLGDALGGLIDFVSGVFTKDWEKAWEGVKDIFGGIFNGLISIVEGVINIIVDGLNWFLGKFDGIVTDIGDVIGIDISIPEIPKVDLPEFSLGGFPEDGLFMANHNELVGQFSNGRTAVANNEQITDGIADAVYPAVYNAITDAFRNGVKNSDGDVIVQIDGKTVAKAVRKEDNIYYKSTGRGMFEH